LHPLIADFARQQATDPARDQLAIEKALSTELSALAQRGDFAAARLYLTHARHVAEAASTRSDAATAVLFYNLGFLLANQGDITEARGLYERALTVAQTTLSTTDPLVATILNNLGLLLRQQGEYAEARPLFEKAFRIRRDALGPDHADT